MNFTTVHSQGEAKISQHQHELKLSWNIVKNVKLPEASNSYIAQ